MPSIIIPMITGTIGICVSHRNGRNVNMRYARPTIARPNTILITVTGCLLPSFCQPEAMSGPVMTPAATWKVLIYEGGMVIDAILRLTLVSAYTANVVNNWRINVQNNTAVMNIGVKATTLRFSRLVACFERSIIAKYATMIKEVIAKMTVERLCRVKTDVTIRTATTATASEANSKATRFSCVFSGLGSVPASAGSVFQPNKYIVNPMA